MLRGSMAAGGTGDIEFIDATMDKMMYMNILKKHVKSAVEQLKLPSDYYFQYDNDPKHTARIVKEWLIYNVPKQLNTSPQSPDLNPIEHLWCELKTRVQKQHITSKNDLKLKTTEAWGQIPPTFTRKLVESMPRRLRAVIDARGGHTRY